MTRIVALPMYHPAPAALQDFWTGLRAAMQRLGLADVPQDLTQPGDLEAHWRDPDLLLTQTCGYPFVTDLRHEVQIVGTPCYAADGCEGPRYRSLVVVRRDEPAGTLADLRGRRAAINMPGSQSGWNAFRALVAPLAEAGRFFAAVCETGSHRESMRLVGIGAADVAAIDCVTFALARRNRPDLTEGLRVLCRTASAPGLPLITSRHTPADDLARLHAALTEACADPALAASRSAMLIDGWDPLDAAAYDEILAMQAGAEAKGYPILA